MQGVGEGGALSFLQQTVKGTGREREGCCGQQHEGGRAHPFDAGTMHSRIEYHRHATQGDSATVGLVCNDAGLPCSEGRLLQMLHALVGNINDAV